MNFFIFATISASIAQLVEQLIRNEQVVGSSPIGGSEDCGLQDFGFRIFSHQSAIGNPQSAIRNSKMRE